MSKKGEEIEEDLVGFPKFGEGDGVIGLGPIRDG